MFCFPRVRTSVSSSQDLELSQYLGVVLPGSGVNARDTTPIKTVKINESSIKCEKRTNVSHLWHPPVPWISTVKSELLVSHAFIPDPGNIAPNPGSAPSPWNTVPDHGRVMISVKIYELSIDVFISLSILGITRTLSISTIYRCIYLSIYFRYH